MLGKKINDVYVYKDVVAINFISLQRTHFHLLKKWLNSPHIVQWWTKDNAWSLEDVTKKYATYVEHYKLVDGAKKPIYAFIIQDDAKPIGYIQYYNAYDFQRETAIPKNLPTSLAGLDLYIGEPEFVGKGLGSRVIKQFLNEQVFTKFQASIVDPDKNNVQAIRAYEKAGFSVISQDQKVVWMLTVQN